MRDSRIFVRNAGIEPLANSEDAGRAYRCAPNSPGTKAGRTSLRGSRDDETKSVFSNGEA
jgi:hypothetical protein